jgi:Cu/Ag efflux protein CusF
MKMPLLGQLTPIGRTVWGQKILVQGNKEVGMKSRWFLWLVAVLMGSALAFPPAIISAAEKMEEKKAPEKAKAQSATGDLVSADAKAGTLTVKVKQKDMAFTAESKAVKESLEKVKVGDAVTVSYTEKDGKMVADSVKAAKAEKKEEKKM